jgi:hypothetical protein
MGGISTYLKNKLLDAALGTQFTKPATVYVALYSAAPNADGGGTELTGGAYARATVTNNSTNWPNASAGAKSNGAAFTFATATAAWSSATHWGIFDALTAGNLLWWGSCTTPVAAVEGSVLKFLTGEIDLTLT